MKILYFPKMVVFFCDPYFYATVHIFRQLNYVILVHARVFGMTLKGLVKLFFGW